MTSVATCKSDKAAGDVAGIIEEFKTAYADAVVECLTHETFEEASRIRQLQWKAPRRISLKDAADCYASILHGYNEFQPSMIADLHSEFSDCGIEVTPVREYSVGVYLHVPDKPGLRKRVEKHVQANFQADLVKWQDSGTLHVWWD